MPAGTRPPASWRLRACVADNAFAGKPDAPFEEAIQDELVTVRNDRFVIPVRSDHRTRVQGVAHGFSSSGATVFVEPLETIDANNELQTLRELEQQETARILFALTEELRGQGAGIEMAARAVEELDFIDAKAALHERFDCVVPEIGDPEWLWTV